MVDSGRECMRNQSWALNAGDRSDDRQDMYEALPAAESHALLTIQYRQLLPAQSAHSQC